LDKRFRIGRRGSLARGWSEHASGNPRDEANLWAKEAGTVGSSENSKIRRFEKKSTL